MQNNGHEKQPEEVKVKEPDFQVIVLFMEMAQVPQEIDGKLEFVERFINQQVVLPFSKKHEAMNKARETQGQGLRLDGHPSGDIFIIPKDKVLKIIVRETAKFNKFMAEQERLRQKQEKLQKEQESKIFVPNREIITPAQMAKAKKAKGK